MKYKIVRTDTYNSLLRCIDKALQNNHELRKVCQCKDCKFNGKYSEYAAMDKCYNAFSGNYKERMNPYASCEKCERR
jgi:hypothetical protein